MGDEQSKTELEILLINKGIYKEAKNIELQKLDREIQLEKAKKSNQSSVVQKGILVAIIGLIATIFGAIYNGNNSKEIEEQQHYSNLILKALDVDNSQQKRETQAENIDFLISRGLIKGKVTDSIKNLIYVPNHIETQKILKNFDNAKNSNIESDFTIKAKFDYKTSIVQDELIVNLTNVYIAQLRARAIQPINIYKIRLLLTAQDPNEKGFEIYSVSKPYSINITFSNIYSIDLENIMFEIDLSNIDREYDGYSLTLEISEFYNGSLGYSNAHSNDYVSIKP